MYNIIRHHLYTVNLEIFASIHFRINCHFDIFAYFYFCIFWRCSVQMYLNYIKMKFSLNSHFHVMLRIYMKIKWTKFISQLTVFQKIHIKNPHDQLRTCHIRDWLHNIWCIKLHDLHNESWVQFYGYSFDMHYVSGIQSPHCLLISEKMFEKCDLHLCILANLWKSTFHKFQKNYFTGTHNIKLSYCSEINKIWKKHGYQERNNNKSNKSKSNTKDMN